MRVRYTETALAEIDDIFAHIARDNPHAAEALTFRFERAIESLSQFPEMAAVDADEPGTRVRPVGNYLIFYAIENDEVLSLHVRHADRQRPNR